MRSLFRRLLAVTVIFSKWLIVSTTDRWDSSAEKVLENQALILVAPHVRIFLSFCKALFRCARKNHLMA